MRIAIIVIMVVGLGGCAGQMPGSVLGGECRVFTDPGFAVRGKRAQDSRWIGATQEKGIDVCGWQRPQR